MAMREKYAMAEIAESARIGVEAPAVFLRRFAGTGADE